MSSNQAEGVIMVVAPTSTPISIPVSKREQYRNKPAFTIRHHSAPSPPPNTPNSSTNEIEATPNSINIKLNTNTPARIIDHVNNRTQSGYIYQIPIPEIQPKTDNSEAKQTWVDEIIRLRINSNIGLREWEWSAGESITSASDTDSDTSSSSNSSQQHSYAERVKSFTYTRSDDPILKGRKLVRSKRRRGIIIWVAGDFGDEVDHPEYVPKEDEDSDWRAKPIKNEHRQQEDKSDESESSESSKSSEEE